jgi:branched-chain amino acid transport system substrate-binding protein
MPLIVENNLPTVVSTAPSELVYKPVRPSVFTFGANYRDAFYAQLKYIHDHSEPKDAVYGLVRQDDDFGKEVETGYDRAIKDFGVKDGIRLRFKKGTSNFSAEMAQMKQAGVNVLVNGAIFAGAANILSEARKLDMNLQSVNVWSEGIPASAKLSAPAGYDYTVGDYVALTGPATDKFLEMAKKFTTPEELAGVSRYTFVTYIGLKALVHAMGECGKELTRACTIEKLRQTKDLDTGGLSAPVSFDNPQQLSGTAVAVYQLIAKDVKFKALTDFSQY